MSDGTPLPNRSAETPVSGRDYPEEDPEGRRWSEIWRAAVEELNANALVSDLGANRTDYEPEDGTLYIPTDGGDWYIGTGTGWTNLGPVGDITDHTNDTTNPHQVTSDQVGSPSDTEFTSHTGDTANPHSVTATQAGALPTSGGTVTGDTTFTNTTHDSIDTSGLQNSETSVTISVPSDYSTLQEAITQHHRVVSSELLVNINIESGHVITDPIHLVNNYYGHVKITSTDATVPVGADFPVDESVFEIRRCIGPHLEIKIDCQGNGADGLFVRGNSTATFTGNIDWGVINAANTNARIENASTFHGYYNDFSGAGNHGVAASRAVQVTLGGINGADVSGATNNGVQATRGAAVRCDTLDASGCGGHAVRADSGATISGTDMNCDNAANMGVYATGGSTVYCPNMSCVTPGTAGIRTAAEAKVSAENATIDATNASWAVRAENSEVTILDSAVSGADFADLAIAEGGIIRAERCTTTASTGSDPHETDLSHSPNSLSGAGIIFASSTEV